MVSRPVLGGLHHEYSDPLLSPAPPLRRAWRMYAPSMFRGPQHRPDPQRLARLRKRGEDRSELAGVEQGPKSKKEAVVYGVILLAGLLVAIAILIRIL